MHLRFAGAALWAALHVTAAWSQAASPPGHHGHHPAKGEGTPAAKAERRPPVANAPTSRPTGAYRSPFADYRPFKTDEPLKDWRRANEEVHEAGGHVGLMKSQPTR